MSPPRLRLSVSAWLSAREGIWKPSQVRSGTYSQPSSPRWRPLGNGAAPPVNRLVPGRRGRRKTVPEHEPAEDGQPRPQPELQPPHNRPQEQLPLP